MSLVAVDLRGHVAVVEMRRPPNNFFDEASLQELAQALQRVDAMSEIRCVVLCSEGRHFCAGADLRDIDADGLRRVYREAFAIFTARKPIIAAVQGAAIGGGLGLALAADFRIAATRARFSANFARLGFHHGFGLSVTLPLTVGQQKARDLLYSGRSVSGPEALAMGLCDRVAEVDPREEALTWAQDIASSAPLSLLSIRSTLRRDLVAQVSAALDQEAAAQATLLATNDFREGISASIGKRPPSFVGA
ncbi:enoyl-CoA hydratase [Frankia sp. R43]|uniref:enoyl-CoA hydratase/isomerase family protein n=1 Tax=Frankia sp. R43 TaxID=269536 RepID=UPI0006CA294B|nr:enoyl-CoA hydratase/isomerase family protein [Frankia sp. R43]KPM54394.1 enoyl-CoA hydratase [Frankia sp. R43]